MKLFIKTSTLKFTRLNYMSLGMVLTLLVCSHIHSFSNTSSLHSALNKITSATKFNSPPIAETNTLSNIEFIELEDTDTKSDSIVLNATDNALNALRIVYCLQVRCTSKISDFEKAIRLPLYVIYHCWKDDLTAI